MLPLTPHRPLPRPRSATNNYHIHNQSTLFTPDTINYQYLTFTYTKAPENHTPTPSLIHNPTTPPRRSRNLRCNNSRTRSPPQNRPLHPNIHMGRHKPRCTHRSKTRSHTTTSPIPRTTPTYSHKPMGQHLTTRTNAHYAKYYCSQPFERHRHHHSRATHPHTN